MCMIDPEIPFSLCDIVPDGPDKVEPDKESADSMAAYVKKKSASDTGKGLETTKKVVKPKSAGETKTDSLPKAKPVRNELKVRESYITNALKNASVLDTLNVKQVIKATQASVRKIKDDDTRDHLTKLIQNLKKDKDVQTRLAEERFDIFAELKGLVIRTGETIKNIASSFASGVTEILGGSPIVQSLLNAGKSFIGGVGSMFNKMRERTSQKKDLRQTILGSGLDLEPEDKSKKKIYKKLRGESESEETEEKSAIVKSRDPEDGDKRGSIGKRMLGTLKGIGISSMGILGTLISGFAAVVTSLAPIIGIAAGIIALGIGIALLIKNWDKVKKWWIETAIPGIKTELATLGNAIKKGVMWALDRLREQLPEWMGGGNKANRELMDSMGKFVENKENTSIEESGWRKSDGSLDVALMRKELKEEVKRIQEESMSGTVIRDDHVTTAVANMIKSIGDTNVVRAEDAWDRYAHLYGDSGTGTGMEIPEHLGREGVGVVEAARAGIETGSEADVGFGLSDRLAPGINTPMSIGQTIEAIYEAVQFWKRNRSAVVDVQNMTPEEEEELKALTHPRLDELRELIAKKVPDYDLDRPVDGRSPSERSLADGEFYLPWQEKLIDEYEMLLNAMGLVTAGMDIKEQLNGIDASALTERQRQVLDAIDNALTDEVMVEHLESKGINIKDNEVKNKIRKLLFDQALAESSGGNDKYLESKTSSAKGVWQMTGDTWNALIDKAPIPESDTTANILTKTDTKSFETQAKMAAVLLADNLSRFADANSYYDINNMKGLDAYLLHHGGGGTESVGTKMLAWQEQGEQGMEEMKKHFIPDKNVAANASMYKIDKSLIKRDEEGEIISAPKVSYYDAYLATVRHYERKMSENISGHSESVATHKPVPSGPHELSNAAYSDAGMNYMLSPSIGLSQKLTEELVSASEEKGATETRFSLLNFDGSSTNVNKSSQSYASSSTNVMGKGLSPINSRSSDMFSSSRFQG